MVDISGTTGQEAAVTVLPSPAPVPDVATVQAWIQQLSRVDPVASEAERVSRLRALEELKAAAAGAQVKESAALDGSIRAQRAAEGRSVPQQRRGIAAQIALARRESPHRGRVRLRAAKVLAVEMPHTLAALCAGMLSEERAELLVELTAHLSLEHRLELDRRICGDPASLEGLGTRTLADRVRRLAYRLDPEHPSRRVRHAVSQRRVTLRPAPEAMAWLTALVPAQQGRAAYVALSQAADAARASGDERTPGQVLADTLVERVTGQAVADKVSAEVQVVITDRALFGGDAEPAHLVGYGTVPAGFVRDWLRPQSCGAAAVDVWLRRLYTHPATGELVGMDSRRRLFPAGLRRFMVVRDQSCRTPYCDAPIRHADHVRAYAAAGPTSAENLQGKCEACSYAKEAPGWRSWAAPPDPEQRRHTVRMKTPTGHVYDSTAPPLPGTPGETSTAAKVSRLETRLRKLLASA